MERIIVGMDGSPSAARAMRWALHESATRSAEITAVLMWDYLGQHHPDGSTSFDPDYDEGRAAAALDTFVVDAIGATAAQTVGAETVFGLAAPGLVALAQDASLLVLGARGLGGFRGLLLGSVSQHCLHESSCPIAIVRGAHDAVAAPHGRIVVGVDGDPHSLAALRWAGREAGLRGAQLRVVHAHPDYVVEVPALPHQVSPSDVTDKESRAVLEHAVGVAGLDPSLKLELIPATGSPAKALIEAGYDADLMVVGRVGRSVLKGLVIGSVATQLSHHSPIPTVFVPSQH